MPGRRCRGWQPSTQPAGVRMRRGWGCGQRAATGTWKRGERGARDAAGLIQCLGCCCCLRPSTTCSLAWCCPTSFHPSTHPPTLPRRRRLEELADIGREGRALQAAAHELDHRLRQTPFRTLTHGDYKTANLLFGSGSDECAAYDFQYVGGGSGMKDVVYLFCSGLSARLLAQQEEVLLRHYHGQLIEGLRAAAGGGGSTGIADPAAAAEAVERYTYEAMLGDYRLALCDYVRFMAGWGFWGNTSWASTKARQFLGELGLTS